MQQKPLPRIAIVADDLTGALDAAAPFVAQGLRAVVATAPVHLHLALSSGAEVIALSTNSREIPVEEAVAILARVAASLQDVPVVFKKIDSRLKGHVAAEVSVLAKARGLSRALLCPAIPEMGRLVEDGRIVGFGVQTPLLVAEVLAGTGLDVIVPDATSDHDIDSAVARHSDGALLIGARGLSAGLARHLYRGKPVPLPPLPYPMAFAIGSRDAITLAQVAHLRRTHQGAAFCAAPNGAWAEMLPLADIAILQTVPGPVRADAASVTAAFAAAFVQNMVPERRTLLLTGGETARAVLAEMGIGVLDLLGEVQPGLPLARPLDFRSDLLIVAKSGGFGAEDALSRLIGPPQPLTPVRPES